MAPKRKEKCSAGCKLFNHLFRLPKDITSRQAWLNVVRLPREADKPSARLCEKHFNAEMFGPSGGRLLPWAMPHFVQPYREQDIYTSQYSVEQQCQDPINLGSQDSLFIGKVESDDNLLGEAQCSQYSTQETHGELQLEKDSSSFLQENISLHSFQTGRTPQTSGKASQTAMALSLATPRKKTLRGKVRRLQAQIRRQNYEFKKFKKHVYSSDFFIQRCNHLLPRELARVLESSIRNSGKAKKGKRYSRDVKATALMLHFLSANSYKYIKDQFCPLPTVRTLQRFTESWPSAPGNMAFNLKAMEFKYMQITEFSKYCVLCIDEMSLKSHLYYDRSKGIIIGLTDNGRVKTDKLARNACVIMVRGLCENWKFPLDYMFVESSCPAAEAKRLIFEAVRGLRKIGFHPVALVSDMGSNFQALSSMLGISPNNSFVTIDSQPLFYFFDTPHLLKLVKNNFAKYDVVFDKDKRASFKHVEKFFEIDSKHEFKLAPKLSNAHIYPNSFQKMSVKNSTQVLSHSVACGLGILVKDNKLPATALDTVEFIKKMDKLFDIFNSSKFSEPKEMNRPFVGSESQLQFLTEARDLISNLRFINSEGKDVTNSIKCLKGWLINIESLSKLWDFLNTVGFKFILTRRINQDPLENFFGAVRKQGGNCHHPTARLFSFAFKKLWGMKFLEISKSGNCEYEKDPYPSVAPSQHPLPDISWMSETSPVSQCPATVPTDYKELDYIEENAITYVAGYLFKKCKKWHVCPTNGSEANDSNSCTFIQFKQYDNSQLIIPPKAFVDYIKRLEEGLKSCFPSTICRRYFDSCMFDTLSNIEEYKCCDEFDNIRLLWLFIRVRVYYKLKYINKKLRIPDTKKKIISVCNL